MKYLREKSTLGIAASKTGMDEKTDRKYRDLGKLPSEIKAEAYGLGKREKTYLKGFGGKPAP